MALKARNSLSSLIRRGRTKKKLKQDELATQANISQAAIGQIETGMLIPGFDLLGRISGFLDLSYDELCEAAMNERMIAVEQKLTLEVEQNRPAKI